MTSRYGSSAGYLLVLAAAVAFGLSAPLAKLALTDVPPLVASGLLYLGSGLLTLLALPTRRAGQEANLRRSDWPWLVGSVAFGGLLGPVALMIGLRHTSGTAASLLLNLEPPMTVLIAVLLGEHASWRLLGGGLAILAGAATLGLAGSQAGGATDVVGLLALGGTCLAWAIDNNLSLRLANRDPYQVVAVKALAAAIVAFAMAWAIGHGLPSNRETMAGLAIGAVGYGASMVCFLLAMRRLGTARTGVLFAAAPFIGALAAIPLLHEHPGWPAGLAAWFMLLGTWILAHEDHGHEHQHEATVHEHRHVHDSHHQHTHDGSEGPEPHSHLHQHEPLVHSHPHTPDLHHRHGH